MHVYTCNYILTTSTNNRSDKEMIRYFTELTEYLKSRGINPGLNFMDNEASKALNMTMTTMNINYQLFPPSNHISNNTDRAIKTFKNQFISGLCSVDKHFHLKLWYRPLHQETISINLLRQSITLPHLSAYTHIFGSFDSSRTPLDPPGIKVVIHNMPSDRTS